MTWVRVDVVMDPDVRAAIGLSTLRGLPPEVLARLTAEATKAPVRAGHTIHGEGEAEPHLELVTAGLVRARVSAPGG